MTVPVTCLRDEWGMKSHQGPIQLSVQLLDCYHRSTLCVIQQSLYRLCGNRKHAKLLFHIEYMMLVQRFDVLETTSKLTDSSSVVPLYRSLWATLHTIFQHFITYVQVNTPGMMSTMVWGVFPVCNKVIAERFANLWTPHVGIITVHVHTTNINSLWNGYT